MTSRESDLPLDGRSNGLVWLATLAAVIAAFLFAYWPCLCELVAAWERSPDYSHGYLVAPMAILLLWLRRDSFPGFTGRIHWAGLSMLALSIVVRIAGAALFVTPVDGWSIMVWAAGAAWLLFGPRVLWWSLPAIGFLFFMVPLPFRMETMLSVPLQRIATTVSCWVLMLLGQPAIAEGNVINIGEHTLFVAEACSGVRIFVGILALTYLYVVLVKRSWWERLILVAAALPVALVANVTRIVVTSLLYQFASGEAARRFSHDWAGFAMIPFAAALFALVVWYIARMFPVTERMDMRTAIREAR